MRNKNLKLKSGNTRICSAHFEAGEKLSRNHLPSIFPWTKGHSKQRTLSRISQEDLVKRAKSEGRPELEEILSTRDDTDNIVPHPEYSVNHSINACSSNEENVDLLSHQESDHDQLKAENKELRYDTTDNIVPHPEYSDIHSINACSSNEENVDLLSHQESDHEQLNAENKELRYNLEELKLKLKQMEDELESVKIENKSLRQDNYKLNHPVFDITKHKVDSNIAFYTGFPNWDTFMLWYNMIKDSASGIIYGQYKKKDREESIIGRPKSLSIFEEFTLVMMRLRLGLFEKDLGHRFGISQSTVSTIFHAWIHFLHKEFEGFVSFPRRSSLQEKMPKMFKELYPKTVVIIDAVEFRMQSPSALDLNSASYSSYKGTTTMKGLVGISPSGVVSFMSELYTGSISDKELTMASGLYKLLSPGDDVMANKGFDIQDG
ncbi:uncharacterized protein [Montipora capricornis]|uniref:uncharacterized protein n=1 Tax=Montipora capricornis TaxID=246305 RepID=UPI0035F1AE04